MKVLLVDDDPHMREMASEMLGVFGHGVIRAEDGRAALDTFAASPDTFGIVITDLDMPRMAGDELIARIRELRPDCPLVAMTGLVSVSGEGDGPFLHGATLLRKPFTMGELQDAIRSAMPGPAE